MGRRGGQREGVRRRLTRALAVGASPGVSAHERVLRRGVVGRLVVGIVMGLLIALVPASGFPSDQRLLGAGIVLGYALLATVIELALLRRAPRTARTVNGVLGFLGVAAVGVAIPEALVPALFALVLAVIFYSCTEGLGVGLVVATAATAVAFALQWHAPADVRVTPLVMVTFWPYTVSVALLVEWLTRERRERAQELERLFEALRGVTPLPELEPTLEAVRRTAVEAVDALTGAVVLHDGEAIERAVPSPARELTLPAVHPTGGGCVVVHDVAAPGEPRAEWVRALPTPAGVRSLALVPIAVGDLSVGVLVLGFAWLGGPDHDERRLLDQIAEQTGVLIVRARAYERERLAARRLAEADHLKTEFVALASHELRTPLAASKGFTATVLQHWERLDDDRRRALLERALRNQDDLARLVDRLLDFTLLEARELEVDAVELSLATVADEVADDLAAIFDGVALTVDVPADLTVHGGGEELRRVLANLLSNAAKYTPPGGAVTVQAQRVGDEVRVDVVDTGVGIDPADHERIFEPFVQVGAARVSRRGTGIGLAIARRFVEAQGGRLTVSSTPGRGSTFSFTIPAAAGGRVARAAG